MAIRSVFVLLLVYVVLGSGIRLRHRSEAAGIDSSEHELPSEDAGEFDDIGIDVDFMQIVEDGDLAHLARLTGEWIPPLEAIFVNHRDANGRTPLMIAQEMGHTEVAKYLIAMEERVSQSTGDDGQAEL